MHIRHWARYVLWNAPSIVYGLACRRRRQRIITERGELRDAGQRVAQVNMKVFQQRQSDTCSWTRSGRPMEQRRKTAVGRPTSHGGIKMTPCIIH